MIFAISEINGNYAAFLKLLEVSNFNPQKDNLFILGNFMGNKYYETVELINHIQAETRNKCFYPVLGPNEKQFLNAFLDWDYLSQENAFKNKKDITTEYYLHPYVRRNHIKFLKKLPYYWSTNNYVFSHIGQILEADKDITKLNIDKRNIDKVKDKLSVYAHYDAVALSEGKMYYYEEDTNSLCINAPLGGKGKGYLTMIRLDDKELFFVEH